MDSKLTKKWVEAELKEIISHVIGGDWGKDPSSITEDDFVEVLCIRGSEIKKWNENKGNTASLRKIKKNSLQNRKLEVGDILVEISGGGPDQPVGRTVLIDEEVLKFESEIPKVCTNFLRLLRIYDNLNSVYINHYFHYFYDIGEIVKYQGGSNNLRNLKFKEFETIKVPLPPLAEQNRIVVKLDRLFAQLEILKTSMAKIPLLLKNFRQQVLTQAVTGKLTEEWRKGKELERNTLSNTQKFDFAFEIKNVPKNWEIYPIGNVFSFQQGMQIAKSTRFTEPKENTLPILRIKNYHDGFQTDVEHIEVDEKSLIAEPEDVILTRTGESRGWVLSGFKGVFHNNTFRINFPKDKIINSYLKYYLSSNDVQNYIKISSGRTGQPDLTHRSFGPCPILIPPHLEQQEIVRRVESLFANADAIEQQYRALKDKIDTLPQAILHKAFKGELSEQLDTDGDAKKLLKQIQELKNSTTKSKKATTKKTKSYPEGDDVLGMVAEK